MRQSALILAGLLLEAWITSSVAYAAGAVGTVTHLSGVLTAKRADGTTKLISVK
ncbi:MAG: hypothetical protein IH605_15920, partial [Burkholderiales bacterium]|nr:hypothetical protein [Burkholderiales bacterium]